MSTYTSQEEKIILKDNNEIIFIDLENNRNVKVLIIDNLPNLKDIHMNVNENLYVSISNCVNLDNIIYGTINHKNIEYASYFYLGAKLNSLKHVRLLYFKTVKIENEILHNLESLDFSYIKELICDFNNFPMLSRLTLENVSTANLILTFETISFLVISSCSFENVEILGKYHINDFQFNNNKYKSLKIEHDIRVSNLVLYKSSDKVIPYISLSDDIDKNLAIFINMYNVYDSQYKYFIERNLSKIYLINEKHEQITLDDVRFDIPQKKRAR